MRCPKFMKLGALFMIAFLIFSLLIATGPAAADNVTSTDSDGDGLSNNEENSTGTDPMDPDSDGDGLTDGYEVENDLDPLDDAAMIDVYESDDDADRQDVRDSLMNTFFFTFLMAFAIFALLAGAFTAYFGAGKSRAIGGGLMVVGIIIILVWLMFGVYADYPDDTLLGIIHWEAAKTLEAFITVLAALIGAVAAIGLFLVAIMKS